MKKILTLTVLVSVAGSLIAADSADTVKKAAKALAEKSNYSWRTSTEFGGNAANVSEGKTEKNGPIFITMTRGDRTTEAVVKGEKGAMKTDEGWKSLSEAAEAGGGGGGQGFGGGRMIARMLQNYKAPAAEAESLASKAKDLKSAEGVISGTLTEEGAKEMMMFRRRAGSEGPEIKDAKGTVKFWVKDGVLSKYEYSVQGSMSFNGNERDVNRTTTVEIKDVGSTKVAIPAEAAKKIES